MSKTPRTAKKQVVTSRDEQPVLNSTTPVVVTLYSVQNSQKTAIRRCLTNVKAKILYRFSDGGDANGQLANRVNLFSRLTQMGVEPRADADRSLPNRVGRLDTLQNSYINHHDASGGELSPKRAFT